MKYKLAILDVGYARWLIQQMDTTRVNLIVVYVNGLRLVFGDDLSSFLDFVRSHNLMEVDAKLNPEKVGMFITVHQKAVERYRQSSLDFGGEA